jgi:hypothetical protein
MDGPVGMLSLVEMLSTDKVGPGDTGGIEKVLGDTLYELKQLQGLHQKRCTDFDALAQGARDVSAKLKVIISKLNEARIATCIECDDNPVADSNSLAMQLLPLEREAELLQDSLDLLTFVRIPDALDAKLEVTRDLRRIEHLEASLYSAHSHATMLQKLDRAGFSESHERVVAVSETTEKLKLAAAEALRQAQLSDAQLTDERATRVARTAARRASAQITKIEAALAALELSRSTQKE